MRHRQRRGFWPTLIPREGAGSGHLLLAPPKPGTRDRIAAEEKRGLHAWYLPWADRSAGPTDISGMSLVPGQAYRMSLRAKGSSARELSYGVGQNGDPWRGYTSGQTTRPMLGTEWQDYAVSFIAPSDVSATTGIRVLFDLGPAIGTVWIGQPSLTTGRPVLQTGEPLASGTIPLIPWLGDRSFPGAARLDYIRFLRELELSYFRRMTDFLKRDLGVTALIKGSQLMNSPPTVQAAMDVLDNHSYCALPDFPGDPYDYRSWKIVTQSIGHTPPGLFDLLGSAQVAGKPILATEATHSHPSDFAGEGPLLTGAYASPSAKPRSKCCPASTLGETSARASPGHAQRRCATANRAGGTLGHLTSRERLGTSAHRGEQPAVSHGIASAQPTGPFRARVDPDDLVRTRPASDLRRTQLLDPEQRQHLSDSWPRVPASSQHPAWPPQHHCLADHAQVAPAGHLQCHRIPQWLGRPKHLAPALTMAMQTQIPPVGRLAHPRQGQRTGRTFSTDGISAIQSLTPRPLRTVRVVLRSFSSTLRIYPGPDGDSVAAPVPITLF